MTHQCSRRGVIAENLLEPAVVERAGLTSYSHAFPAVERDPDALASIREIHRIGAL
ncbi:hypothetical protein HNQ07_003615 [Deinococcus metalli]|uniref:Uncharacterized protein n=1 Tax=Deinococcus metalli TaxID=1141878 RepID=A0A7W8KH55_9DEIO|nr:hypothetical protein [Deinococcus metalli]MBB5378114.1 hypothetical protein [Deinococcus metalli]GHF54553.1 hypothetical protein GCM10017781_33590 [Deinococcus metalli]